MECPHDAGEPAVLEPSSFRHKGSLSDQVVSKRDIYGHLDETTLQKVEHHELDRLGAQGYKFSPLDGPVEGKLMSGLPGARPVHLRFCTRTGTRSDTHNVCVTAGLVFNNS